MRHVLLTKGLLQAHSDAGVSEWECVLLKATLSRESGNLSRSIIYILTWWEMLQYFQMPPSKYHELNWMSLWTSWWKTKASPRICVLHQKYLIWVSPMWKVVFEDVSKLPWFELHANDFDVFLCFVDDPLLGHEVGCDQMILWSDDDYLYILFY